MTADISFGPCLELLRIAYILRATSDKGPRSRDQWIQAKLLVETFKLIPRPLDEDPKQKKWQIEAKTYMAPVLEGKSIGWDQKNSAKSRAPDLKNQESG